MAHLNILQNLTLINCEAYFVSWYKLAQVLAIGKIKNKKNKLLK